MENEIANRGEILLYGDDNGKEFINVVFKDETFWLTQKGMAELFDCSTDNISLHLKNIYADGELKQTATTEKISVVRTEGTREVSRTRNSANGRMQTISPNLTVKQKSISRENNHDRNL